MRLRNVLAGALVVGLLGAAAPVHAADITGEFGIAGSITYDVLNNTGGAGLDMQSTLPPPTGGSGPFTEVTLATGYFDTTLGMGPLQFSGGFFNGTVGSILNIDNVPLVPNYTYAPAGVPINIPNYLFGFITFVNNVANPSGLHFDLTNLPLSGFGPCPFSNPCGEGPFTLQESSTGVTLSWDVLGNFVNGADSGAYIGLFTVSIAGETINDIGTKILAGQDVTCNGGTANNPIPQPCAFGATFKPLESIPEPATMLTFGAGSLLLARMRRRKKA